MPNDMSWEFLGATPGSVFPVFPEYSASATLALLLQLESTERLPAARLEAEQARQIAVLARYAWDAVPYYRREWAGRYDPSVPLTLERLRSLPVLTRSALKEHYEALASRTTPAGHGAAVETRSSGSTGAPVRVRATDVTRLFWDAITLRDHAWHRRDLGGKLAVIRRGVLPGSAPSWGKATAGLVRTGEAVMLDVDVDIGSQLDWLERQAPAYLLTYPSLAAELAKESLVRGRRLAGLLQVRTLGESLGPDVRALCREAWGAALVDVYSAEEVGYIALQCPEHEHYHVQAESVLVEILDEGGAPCAPGQAGRVVVTDLHNFATPLIRYELGDYAEFGAPCPCGRGLPVLQRIAGRTRNILLGPDGKRYWPALGSRFLGGIASVRQHQMVQKRRNLVELRLVASATLTADEENALREHVRSRLPAGVELSFVYCADIPRGPSGKFEYFISEVAA
jgi:phenylacetate-CoA ligase